MSFKNMKSTLHPQHDVLTSVNRTVRVISINHYAAQLLLKLETDFIAKVDCSTGPASYDESYVPNHGRASNYREVISRMKNVPRQSSSSDCDECLKFNSNYNGEF